MNQQVALNTLVISPINVRKTATDVSELSANILAMGQLQNLSVIKNGEKYEVVAGGRRLLAMQNLASQNKIPNNYLVNVQIIDAEKGVSVSLSENSGRSDMHPADEFDAIKVLISDGVSVEAIAASYGVTPSVISRRLRLANASPSLIAQYRNEEIELDQLMALCGTSDHKLQNLIWKNASGSWRDTPSSLRKAVLEQTKAICSDDRLVKFVTIEAYKEAGGAIQEDLFATEFDGIEGDSILADTPLLMSLAKDKLDQLSADAQKKSKFGWQEANLEDRYLPYSRFNKHTGKTPANAKQFLGVFCYVDGDGVVKIEKNLVRNGDAKKLSAALIPVVEGSEPVIASEGANSPELPSNAVLALTAQRTIALQAQVAQKPMKAIRLLVARMMSTYEFGEIHVTKTNAIGNLTSYDSTISTSTGFKLLDDYADSLATEELEASENLLERLDKLDDADVIAILAYLTAKTISCVKSTVDGDDVAYQVLGKYVDLDIAKYWKPTAENYFSKLNKSKLLSLISEKDTEQRKGDEKLKRGELAQLAEQLYAGSDFMPAMMEAK